MAVREEKGVVRWRENNSSSVCIHVCDFVCVCVCLFTRDSGHRCADSERAVCEHKSVTARIKKKKQHNNTGVALIRKMHVRV